MEGCRWRQTQEYQLGLPTRLTLEHSVWGEYHTPIACPGLGSAQDSSAHQSLGGEKIYATLTKLPKIWQWGSRPLKLSIPPSSAERTKCTIVELPHHCWVSLLLSGRACLYPPMCLFVILSIFFSGHTFILVDKIPKDWWYLVIHNYIHRSHTGYGKWVWFHFDSKMQTLMHFWSTKVRCCALDPTMFANQRSRVPPP